MLLPLRLSSILRPRWTWRYLICAGMAVYAISSFLLPTSSSPLLSSNLPAYTGPYAVGAIDLEIPLERSRTVHESARFKDTDDLAFQVGLLQPDADCLALGCDTGWSRRETPSAYWRCEYYVSIVDCLT